MLSPMLNFSTPFVSVALLETNSEYRVVSKPVKSDGTTYAITTTKKDLARAMELYDWVLRLEVF